MTLHPMGDAAVVLDVGRFPDEATLARVRAVADGLQASHPAGTTDVVPAFGSVTVFYDPSRVGDFEKYCIELERLARKAAEVPVNRTRTRDVEIPVCYGGDYGPDLAMVAEKARLTEAETVSLHSGVQYRVNAIGFAPGFPYLGGLPPRLYTPRRATPRTWVPAGSVGIGSAQTGVYPLAGPGGWNLIGRTPLKLFASDREPPALLATGDRVRFRAITPEEFEKWK